MENIYNPWHGCHKYSSGCLNCYVYRRDESIGKDASIVRKTASFDIITKRKRNGEYKVQSTSLYTCMTSDFFIEEADAFRDEVWKMIRERSDIYFTIITKRIKRVKECLPTDWGDGYDNVAIWCTMENQAMVDERLPIYLSLPIKSKTIILEPLLSDIDFHHQLDSSIKQLVVGGESGDQARVCNYEWVKHIRKQALEANISFYFKQTGENFIKDGRSYRIARKLIQSQARKANIDF